MLSTQITEKNDKMNMSLYSLNTLCNCLRFEEGGPPLPFSPSRVRWLKAINKVRVQLREVGNCVLLIPPESRNISNVFTDTVLLYDTPSPLSLTPTSHIF